jgi:hypothetical protein
VFPRGDKQAGTKEGGPVIMATFWQRKFTPGKPGSAQNLISLLTFLLTFFTFLSEAIKLYNM